MRFLGHNLRHGEPVTNKCLIKVLTAKKKGRWAKKMLADVEVFANSLREKNVFAKNDIVINDNMNEYNALMATVMIARKLK